MSKFYFFSVFIFLVFVYFANGDTVEFRARKTETLTIFAFDEAINSAISPYVYYLANLVSLWDVNKSIIDYNNIPQQLFFGKYNATSLLNAADPENTTAAFIVLINNDEFYTNATTETNLLNFTSTTKCNQIFLCNIMHKFLNTPRDPLTKLNLVFLSNICPDSSLFKEFYNFDKEIGYNSTKTYLISNSVTTDNQICKNNNLYLSHQFIPNFNDKNYSFKADTELLADPRFEFDTKYADSDMYVTINETNYNKAIKSVADYYNNNPLNYQITLTIQSGLNSKQIVTVIPKVDYKSSSFTLEEYLKQNFDYLLERSGNKNLINFDITKAVETSKSKNIILFSDDKENLECFSKSDVRYIRI